MKPVLSVILVMFTPRLCCTVVVATTIMTCMTNQINNYDRLDTAQDRSSTDISDRPTLDLRNQDQRRERMRQLKRSGINGEKVGAGRILAAVITEGIAQGIPYEFADDHFESESHVRRLISKTKFMGDEDPYEYGNSTLPEDQKSYVHRLEIVKAALLNGERFTNREAKLSERTFVEFQDPHGEQVDLIAQFAVLFELAERAASDQETSDIEDLFAFAPWKSNKQSQLYLLARREGLIKSFAMLRLIAPLKHVGDQSGIPPLFIGAHAQLNLPYIWSWVQEWDDKPRDFMVTLRDNELLKETKQRTDAGFLRDECDWRVLLTERLTDQPFQQITIAGNDQTETETK